MEQELVSIKRASDIHFCVSTWVLRKLSYQLSVGNGMRMTTSWIKAFPKRHTDLSIPTPQPTSLVRATSYNEHNVQSFFNNLKSCLEQHKFAQLDIYFGRNGGHNTVQRPAKL